MGALPCAALRFWISPILKASTTARDLRKGLLRVRAQLVQRLFAARAQARAQRGQRLVERGEQRGLRMLPQELVPRSQRAQIISRIGQMRRMPVLHGPIEQLAPP